MSENNANKRTFLIDDVLYETVRGGSWEGERLPVEGDRVVVTKIDGYNVAPSLASVYSVQGEAAFNINPSINGVPDMYFDHDIREEYYVVTSAKLLADIGTEQNAEGRTSASESDNVNQPSHYRNSSRFETIEIIEEITQGYDDGYVGMCVGNALKYLSRGPYKHEEPTEDLLKAGRYIAFATEYLAKKAED